MTKRKSSVILPVVLIVLSICVILGTTLAYFTDTRDTTNPVNFGKIEISVNEPFEETIPIKNALPGDKIVDKISFTKAIDSEDMYVRVKAVYETTSTVPGVQDLVDEINTYSIDLATGADYVWDTSYINYYYLVTASNADTLYNVTEPSEIVFTDEISIPRELRQLDNYAQYMETISLKIEIQAIQSQGVSSTLTDVNDAFSETLGEAEILPTNPSYFTFDGSIVTGLTEEGKALSKIIIPSSYSVVDSSQPSNAYGPSNAGSSSIYTYGNEFQVTSIGNDAFIGCSNLTSITIPNGITSIGDRAFSNCSSLTSITIPDCVMYIGFSAFHGCTGLEKTEGNLIYISTTDNEYFALLRTSNERVTSETINNNCKFIFDYAFNLCRKLTSITIPSGVISIGNNAFGGCDQLVQIRNLSGQTMQGLTINVGQEVLTNSEDTFTNVLKEEGRYITYQVDSKKYLMGFIFDSRNATSVNDIPAGVTDIYNYAFEGCTNLKSVTIPASVRSIGSTAFATCTGLSSIDIPEGVITIKNAAFMGCSNLKSVNIPDSVSSISIQAFESCSSLTSVKIPESLTRVVENLFKGCKNLESITIPSSITRINESAFRACINLKSVYYIGTSTQWTTLNSNIASNNTTLTNADRYYIYFDESNELVVAVDNAGEEVAVDSSAYTAVINDSDDSKIVATVTFLNGEGDEDNYRVTTTKVLA